MNGKMNWVLCQNKLDISKPLNRSLWGPVAFWVYSSLMFCPNLFQFHPSFPQRNLLYYLFLYYLFAMGFILFKPLITNTNMLNSGDQTFSQLGKPQSTIKEIFEICLNFSRTAWCKLKYHPHHTCSCLSIFFFFENRWSQVARTISFQKRKTKTDWPFS